MKTGIIGLPQVGKTSLFGILTKVHLSEQAYSNPREAHIGVAKVPDERLDKLAALYHPKKLTHASVEYVDVGAIGQDALKETAYIGHLRQVDALIHVLRAFENDEVPHVGAIDPLRDIKNVEFDLMVTDLGKDLEAAVAKYNLTEVAARPNAGASAICGKVEAELAEMTDEDAAEFLGSYGLTDSGLSRLIRKSYHLLGLISFFTAGEDE